MSTPEEDTKQKKQNTLNLILAAVVGQVGCFTLLIIIVAVLGGMALDARFETKPWFTIGLVVASIPISLLLMFFIARKAIAKIKTTAPDALNKEDGIGKNS